MTLRVGSIFLVLFLLSSVARSLPIDGNSIDEPQDYEAFATDAALIYGEGDGEDEEDEVIDLSRVASELFRNPDNDTGKILERYSPETDKFNPEEMGSYLEGDMLIKKAGRNGLISQSSKWPGGVVPFAIKGSFNAHEMDMIERGIKEYHAKTCIRFKPRTSERDYISFENDPSGCWSSVGKIGGKQEVNLQTPGCLSKIGTVLHEVMHALGFLHEQNRHERDSYVDIVWPNIQSSTRTNFDKATSATTHAYGVGYDYGSVMHYSAYAFSTNGRATIVSKDSSHQNAMGQRDGFSPKDLQKLNAMYCRSSNTGGSSSNNNRPAQTPRPSYRPTQRPTRPRPPSGQYPQRPNTQPQRPQRPPSYPSGQGQGPVQGQGNNNNPFISFLGGFINGLMQQDGTTYSDTAESGPVGQPRTILPIPKEATA